MMMHGLANFKFRMHQCFEGILSRYSYSTRGDTCPVIILITADLTRTGLSPNPDIRSERYLIMP